jgi:hypothetical protein
MMSATFSKRFGAVLGTMCRRNQWSIARGLLKDKGRGMVKRAEWSESDGLLMFHGKIYVL